MYYWSTPHPPPHTHTYLSDRYAIVQVPLGRHWPRPGPTPYSASSLVNEVHHIYNQRHFLCSVMFNKHLRISRIIRGGQKPS